MSTRPWWRQRWLMVGAGYGFALLSGMGVALWLHSHGDWRDGLAWERSLLRAVHVELPRWIDSILIVMPWFGTNITLVPVTLALVLWLALKAKRSHEAVYLGVVQLGSSTLNPVLKFLYERPRPDLIPRRGWYDWAAYPSGHAIASIAVLTTMCVVVYRVKGWRWPGYVVAPLLVVSLFSRIYLGVHWPTDVVGGAAIGLVWLGFTYFAFREDQRRSPTLSSPRPESKW